VVKEAGTEKDRVVSASSGDVGVGDFYSCWCVEKTTKDLFWVSVFKTDDVVCELSVECIANESQHDVEVDLEGDGGTQGVKVEEVGVLS